MPDENKVRIIVNGEAAEYEHWTDVSITSELNTLARSFQVGTTAKLPQSSTLLRSFKLGDEVQIYIGDDLVLTGYIDALPISYNATSVVAAITGRSRTEDLVDCSPAWNGYDFSSTVNSTKWSATRSPGGLCRSCHYQGRDTVHQRTLKAGGGTAYRALWYSPYM